jgi:hypothetical protein
MKYMQRKYVTKKLVKRIGTLTNDLFKQSVIEVMDIKDVTDEQLQDFMSTIRRASYMHIVMDASLEEVKDIMNKKEKIDEIYLNKMMTLSSADLSDILFLHEHAKPRRAERTLEAITSELARRSLLNDSSQSDAIYNNGDVDVKRKSNSARKKANSKRDKTNKSR